MYTLYILKTSRDTLYTGITNNLERRLNEHRTHSKKAAKYMRSFNSFELVYTETFESKGKALKREFQIKKLTKLQKESLIKL